MPQRPTAPITGLSQSRAHTPESDIMSLTTPGPYWSASVTVAVTFETVPRGTQMFAAPIATQSGADHHHDVVNRGHLTRSRRAAGGSRARLIAAQVASKALGGQRMRIDFGVMPAGFAGNHAACDVRPGQSADAASVLAVAPSVRPPGLVKDRCPQSGAGRPRYPPRGDRGVAKTGPRGATPPGRHARPDGRPCRGSHPPRYAVHRTPAAHWPHRNARSTPR